MGGAKPEVENVVKKQRTYVCTIDYALGMEKRFFSILWLGQAHIFGLLGFWMLLTRQVPLTIIPLSFLFGHFAGFGITIGCHRLWTHRSFKAKLPLQLLLAYMQTMAVQFPIFKWCRDHRLHHKYTDTDADPHNSQKGFWFSHLGWHFVPEHPSVKEKEATMDLSDLDDDPLIRFQTKYYYYIAILAFYVIPMSILHLIYPSLTFYQLFVMNYIWYMLAVHFTGFINSVAHLPSWGSRPYDKNIRPSESVLLSVLAAGEGFHNFHHAFPWDYRTSELGKYFNVSTILLDFFVWIGWAYDCKVVSREVVEARVQRTGNVSLHEKYIGVPHTNSSTIDDTQTTMDHATESALPAWGWGDEDITEEQIKLTRTIRASKAA